MTDTNNVLLNIGCGNRFIPGFTHIDIRPFPHVAHVTSADRLGMFNDGSVDLIYACHVLEPFGRHKVDSVLREWYRVLKVGGVVRIAVPDFEALVRVYQRSGNLQLIIGPLVGRQDYAENTHYIIFDYISLSKALVNTRFKNVHRYDWRETDHRDYDDYSQSYIPHMDKVHGTLVSLNVEAEK